MLLSTVRRNIKHAKKAESKMNNSQEVFKVDKTLIKRGEI